MKILAILLVLSILFIPTAPASAAWPENGVRLSAVTPTVQSATIASDGAGGCIAVWLDYRSGEDDIYAQRFDRDGNPLWGANGVAVCVLPSAQTGASIVADDAGGAFVSWMDDRAGNQDMYAQRVASDGTMMWAVNGKPVCVAPGVQTQAFMSSEGGLALVTWTDLRNFGVTGRDIYAQRINGNGDPMWTTDGVAVCTAFGEQLESVIVSDGASGAILAWVDLRAGNEDVYIHHVNFLGTPDWTPQGQAVSLDLDTQRLPKLASDGQGGVILAWLHDVGTTTSSIFAQRFDPSGSSVWPGLSVDIVVGTANRAWFDLAPDGSDGAIIGWTDHRSGGSSDVYVQRITQPGLRLWGPDGTAASTASSDQLIPALAPDGEGGAVVTFSDTRTPGHIDIYGQRIDALGLPRWDPEGTAIVTRPGTDGDVRTVAGSDGAVLMTWQNFTADFECFAQRIDARHGYWGRPDPGIVGAADTPADQGGHVTLRWDASDRDILYGQTITHYSIWRATGTPPAAGAAITMVTPEDITADFKGEAWRHEETAAGAAYWEFVDNQAAAYLEGYSYNVPTKNDSVGGNTGTHYFQVIAHTGDPWVFWPSNPDSAHSVDNLAPAPATGLIAARTGGDNVDLDWSPSGLNEADFKEYRVYRGSTSGFPTDPAFFLTSTPDTMSTDTGASSGSMWYYKVLAVDIHDNPSDGSNEAFVSPVTGIGDRTPALAALTVQNYPNPFSGATEVRIGLPASAPVTMEVYDVAGRRVVSRNLGPMAAGYQAVGFDGRDASGRQLPSGVYFYRVTAGAETATRKIVIRR